MLSRRLLILIGSLALHTCAYALDWKETTFTHTAEPIDEQAEGLFRFTNNGANPVTITKIDSSCGCTVPELAKRIYAPGESGELRAIFKFNSMVGQQHKTVTVITDEPGTPPTVLSLNVTIPQLFEITRYFVVWRRGEEPVAKSIDVKVLLPEVAKLVSVEARDARFSAALEATDDPSVYRVQVTPPPTDAAMQASVVVHSDFPKDEPRVITLYALVR